MIKSIIEFLKHRRIYSSSSSYINYLRDNHIKIGEDCLFRNPKSTIIDITRPSLVEIGNGVHFCDWFTLLTHDFTSNVFLNLYGEFIPSSGKVVIGNNVYFNQRCTVLKNVTIGDNCIFGYGSTIMKDIPANSVAVGTPAKVISTVEEYYKKRCEKSIEEALAYARSIKERFGRMPKPEDFHDDFPLFVNGNEMDKYPTIDFKKTLVGDNLMNWEKNHQAVFKNFDDFIEHAFAE